MATLILLLVVALALALLVHVTRAPAPPRGGLVFYRHGAYGDWDAGTEVEVLALTDAYALVRWPPDAIGRRHTAEWIARHGVACRVQLLTPFDDDHWPAAA